MLSPPHEINAPQHRSTAALIPLAIARLYVAFALLTVDVMRGVRVVVAGVGLAGLSAAHELAAAGAAVTVLDAREYAGGRVRTIRDFVDGQHAELGGEFIESDHKEIVALCQELGLRLVRVLRGGFTHRFRDRHGVFHLSRTATWDELADVLSPLIRRYKAVGANASADTVREFATISLREWLRRENAAPELHSMADALSGFFLADPDDISVLPVVEQIANGGSPAQAEQHRIEGGNDRLIDALVRATPARLLLRHRLRAITQASDRMILSVEDASGMTQEIEADCVVVTFPASTLRDVQIRPALPENQQRAIRRLSYGRAAKALVQSSQSLFGSRRARAFATDTRLGAFWDGSGEQEGPASIVTFLAGGSASRTLRDAAAHDVRDLLSDLCWLAIRAAPITAVHVADWEADPWARGGYAYLDPGFDSAWRPLRAQRAGRIVFAGEHTSERWQGYMNGAVESGRRAARELIGDAS
jgi:monoamine oxidase